MFVKRGKFSRKLELYHDTHNTITKYLIGLVVLIRTTNLIGPYLIRDCIMHVMELESL